MMARRKKILFALSNSLGWKTYRHELTAIAESRHDITPVFQACEPNFAQRALMRRLPGATLRRPIDPIFVWGWHFGRWWRRHGRHQGIDAIHIATQLNAHAFAELDPGPPLSLMIDMTRLGPRNEHEAAVFSARSLDAERSIYQRSSLIACMNARAGESLIGDYDIDPGRIEIVPPSINVPATVRQRCGAPGDLVNIAFVGGDFARKGGPFLLEVHQKAFRDVARLHVVSPQFPKRHRHTNVMSHGGVPYDWLNQTFLPQMDILCLPSYSDQSPWVCVQASAAGRPVVATAVGGIPDLCVHGETGFLVERGDPAMLEQRLGELIHDQALRARMGRQAHAHALENFSAEKNYNALIDRIVAAA